MTQLKSLPRHRCVLAIVGLVVSLLISSGCSFQSRPKKIRCESTLACLRNQNSSLRWLSAHRGGGLRGSSMPENSLPALAASVKKGLPLLEIDVRLTLNQKLFLFHDRTLNDRNFRGPSHYFGKSVDQLNSSDLPFICMPEDPSHCIPTFEKILSTVFNSTSILQIDLKGPDHIKVIDQILLVTPIQIQNQNLLIQCSDLSELRYMRKKYPSVAVLARTNDSDDVRQSLSYFPEIVQVDEEWLTAELSKEIHTKGSKILVKILDQYHDTEEHAEALFNQGVDIVLTDFALVDWAQGQMQMR